MFVFLPGKGEITIKVRAAPKCCSENEEWKEVESHIDQLQGAQCGIRKKQLANVGPSKL